MLRGNVSRLCGCRDELFRQSLSRLREQVVKANTLVREANLLAEEMSTLTDYQVTLQIPAANLSANRKVRIPNGRHSAWAATCSGKSEGHHALTLFLCSVGR